MTDDELNQMNAQHTLIHEALDQGVAAVKHDHPDIPIPVFVLALISIVAQTAKAEGLPLHQAIARLTQVYQVS